jgi:hypothetical protein
MKYDNKLKNRVYTLRILRQLSVGDISKLVGLDKKIIYRLCNIAKKKKNETRPYNRKANPQ